MPQTDLDKDFQAASEMGKIYNAMMDRKLLCDFFLESALHLTASEQALLFLAGNDDQVWLESRTGAEGGTADLQKEAQQALKDGKPVLSSQRFFAPLLVRNSIMGVACFSKTGGGFFTEKNHRIGCDLAAQAAAALKNILLFEDNLKMERLAAIGRTTSMVMHEIKNIIQIAKFAEEYLKMGTSGKDPKFLTKGIDMVGKSIREMDGFTYEMLSLTKDYKILPQRMDLAAALEELKGDLKDRAEQYKVELDFKVEEPLGEVHGEVRSLYRALLNIIKNAIEACEKEPAWIKVRVRSLNTENYEIRIEDNGKGMPDEVKAKIFQAFFSTKGEQGTGLGLLIIDRTVKAHGGNVRVESELGRGTVFILTLPKKISTAS